MTSAISQATAVSERLTVFTPLGVRFWDATLDRQVDDGLSAVAWPMGRPNVARTSFLTSSGIHAFRDLPGLRDVEYPRPDAPAVPPARFVVEVRDSLLRFLSVVFTVDLPFRGIFPGVSGTPGTPRPPGFYLFSSATRMVPSHLAVVRVELEEPGPLGRHTPAAFAALEAEIDGGERRFGLTDALGRAILAFPYPSFPSGPAPAGSPLASAPADPRPRWNVSLRVRYAPSARTPVVGSELPLLGSLFAQPFAPVWPSDPRTTSPPAAPVERIQGTLELGRELVVRTEGLSTLLVGPVT